MEAVVEVIKEALQFGQASASFQEILFAMLLSFGLNLLVAATYRRTFRGADLSQDYVHTLLIVGTVVSVVVMVVRVDKESSQATAFGIFAAFSVIRFRTSVGTPKDIGFLFVAMAAGLAVGARAYGMAVATTVILCGIILLVTGLDFFAPVRASHRLRIRVTNDIDYDVAFKGCMERHLHRSELVSVESIQAGMMTELRYNVQLRDASKPGEFVAALQQLNGNNRVMLSMAAAGRELSTE